MKQPGDSTVGGSRKTLPARKARKIQRPARSTTAKQSARKRNILDKDVEQELVKVFGQK